jgi:hypothetical protein
MASLITPEQHALLIAEVTGMFQRRQKVGLTQGVYEHAQAFPIRPLRQRVVQPASWYAPPALDEPPDDTACTLDEWNVKIDALLADCQLDEAL